MPCRRRLDSLLTQFLGWRLWSVILARAFGVRTVGSGSEPSWEPLTKTVSSAYTDTIRNQGARSSGSRFVLAIPITELDDIFYKSINNVKKRRRYGGTVLAVMGGKRTIYVMHTYIHWGMNLCLGEEDDLLSTSSIHLHHLSDVHSVHVCSFTLPIIKYEPFHHRRSKKQIIQKNNNSRKKKNISSPSITPNSTVPRPKPSSPIPTSPSPSPPPSPSPNPTQTPSPQKNYPSQSKPTHLISSHPVHSTPLPSPAQSIIPHPSCLINTPIRREVQGS